MWNSWYFWSESSSENQKNKIKNCLSISHHRGPDGGIFTDEKSYYYRNEPSFYFRYKEWQQPLFSQDGRYCIIFNGEIVNSEFENQIKKGNNI